MLLITCLSLHHLRKPAGTVCEAPQHEGHAFRCLSSGSVRPQHPCHVLHCLAPSTAGQAQQRGHVFWDLDNIRPAAPHHLPFWAHRFRSALAGRGGDPGCIAVTCYANTSTLKRLGTTTDPELRLQEIADALGLVGAQLVATKVRSQSADLAMRSELYAFAQSRGGGVAAVVSNDHGFAPILRYCAGRGCLTLHIGTPATRRRPEWAPPRSPGRLPLAQAAHAALTWDPAGKAGGTVGEAGRAEEAWLLGTSWLDGEGEPWREYRRRLRLGAEGGFVGGLWCNPDYKKA